MKPPVIHIVGRRNHGKTTLLELLCRELRGRGVRVGTVKHSSHQHELDRPGKDSYRHRQAGADPVAVLTPGLAAVYLPGSDSLAWERIAPLFADCDLVLVEGAVDRPGVKLEVWRAGQGQTPLALERSDIVAVITDDDPGTVRTPCWPRAAVEPLCDRVLELAARAGAPQPQ